jgi:HEAT repeat protein
MGQRRVAVRRPAMSSRISSPLSMGHIELALDPETPFHLDFDRAKDEVVVLLARAVDADDVELAVRAAAVCGHVRIRETLEVLVRAAHSARPALREAAAAALEFRTDDAPTVLAGLLMDPDVQVRTRALMVLARRPPRRRVRHIAALRRLRADPDSNVRGLAKRVRVLRSQRMM